MKEEQARLQTFQNIGAVCAIVGTVFTMAAGANFENLTNEVGTETVLQTISSYPVWYWPAVHLSFIFGAVLWACAFVALAYSFRQKNAWVLGRLGAVSMLLGVAIHIVDSSISGFGLAALADAWDTAPATKQSYLVRQADTLLHIMRGTWTNVLNFYSGLPFIISGLAVALGHRYPTWLGWIGVIGGTGSLLMGILMFLGSDLIPHRVYIAFAILVSLWTLVMGILMWRLAKFMKPTFEMKQ